MKRDYDKFVQNMKPEGTNWGSGVSGVVHWPH